MLNRTNAPEINTIETISFVKPKVFDLSGKVKLFFMKEVPNETSRIDLYFDAGTVKGSVGISSIVNGLLLSGTESHSSTEIQNKINDLGGFYESNVSHENAVISIYALKENILQIVEIISNAISGLSFRSDEVTDLIRERKQKFKVSMEKVNTLAQRAFQQRLFSESAYGRIIQEEDFDRLHTAELKSYFEENYLNGLTKIVVVGNLPQDEVDQLMDLAGKWGKSHPMNYEKDIQNLKGYTHIVKDGALQTAVRVGRTLFTKKHPDYPDFLILNTILGDYFGSRLMSNIREDKGYTYGIGSMVAELHEVGYFLIGTEVGSEVKEATLEEIKIELKRLQEEEMETEELELVKNYMLGQLLKSADGPYNMTDLYMSVESYGLDFDFYNKCIASINQITPKRIQELALKYLNWEEMTIVTAG